MGYQEHNLFSAQCCRNWALHIRAPCQKPQAGHLTFDLGEALCQFGEWSI